MVILRSRFIIHVTVSLPQNYESEKRLPLGLIRNLSGQIMRLVTQIPEAHGFYSQVKLTEAEIQNKNYKRYLGGGERGWEKRGGLSAFFSFSRRDCKNPTGCSTWVAARYAPGCT